MTPDPSDSRSFAALGNADTASDSPGSAADDERQKTVFRQWLARKAVRDIFDGDGISPEVAAELDKANPVKEMRERFKEYVDNDARALEQLLHKINTTEEGPARRLMVSILENFRAEEKVQTCLLNLWRSLAFEAQQIAAREPNQSDDENRKPGKDGEDEIYRGRHNLMWRIGGFPEKELKDHGLFEQWREFQPEAFDLIKSDWERFFEVKEKFTGRDFAGDRSKFRPFVDKRLCEIAQAGKFPRTKIWLYLCVATGSPDWKWARKLLRDYEPTAGDEMAFVRQVAAELRQLAEKAIPGTLPKHFPIFPDDHPNRTQAFVGIHQAFSDALEKSVRADSHRSAKASADPLAEVFRRLFFGFGVLQCEVMSRNLIQEYTQRDVANFHFLTGLLERGDDQLLAEDDLHRALAVGDAWSASGGAGNFSKGLPEAEWNLKECGYPKDTSRRIENSIPVLRKAFARSLSRLDESHPNASKLVIQSWANRMHYSGNEPRGSDMEPRTTQDQRNEEGLRRQTAYIHNGELTFYSLLWTFRVLKKRNPENIDSLQRELNACQCVPSRTNTLPLVFNGDKWELATARDWLLAMGLLYVRQGKDGEEAITTNRWENFWDWLQSLVNQAKGQTASTDVDKAIHLPMKRLCPKRKHADSDGMLDKWGGHWAGYLWDFATSFEPHANGRKNPVAGLSQLLRSESLQNLISYELANVKPMRVRPDTSALAEEAPMNDPVLNTVCRAAYLPAEYLLRQYQPYPMCLLIIPIHRVYVRWIDNPLLQLAPAALVFFTIVGDLGEADFNFEKSPMNWRIFQPYWRLALLMSGAVSGYSMVEAVNDFWSTGQSVIFHDVSKDFNALDRQVYDFTEKVKQVRGRIASAATTLATNATPDDIAAVSKTLSETAAGIEEPRLTLLLRERFINSHIRAQVEGAFYEQPTWCIDLLGLGTVVTLQELIDKLILPPGRQGTYEWARLLVFDDDALQEGRIGARLKLLRDLGVSEKRFGELFPAPRLDIKKPGGAESVWGNAGEVLRPPRLLPLFVFSMRAAYQNAFLTSFFDDRALAAGPDFALSPQVVTLASGTRDTVSARGEDVDGLCIRFPTPAPRQTGARANWHFKRTWERQMKVYRDRNLAYPWTYKDEVVAISPDGTSVCEITLSLG